MKLTPERNKAMAEKLFRHVREQTTDLADNVVAFDPKIYTSETIAEAEKERIFQSQPMMAAHSSEIPEYGDYVRIKLNTVEALITRKKDGTVGAFLNVCRHRGAALTNDDRGKRKIFTCKYHGWTFENDGTHRGIGFQETFGAAPCAKFNLIDLPVEERHGFIWVVEDPEGSIDVEKHLGPEMDQAMSEFGFEDYHYYDGEVLEFPQNWKIMADGLLDGYHVKFLHGATISAYVHHNLMSMNVMTDHSFHATARTRISEIMESEEPGESPLNRYAIFSAYLAPNANLVIHPHHVEFWTLYQHPDGPHKSRSHLRFITPYKVETEKQKEILRKNYDIVVGAVVNEDVPCGNEVQASSGWKYAKSLMLGRNEIVNQLFHRNYDRLMGDAVDPAFVVEMDGDDLNEDFGPAAQTSAEHANTSS